MTSCPHDGLRVRGSDPLVCSNCEGRVIGRAPASRCALCGQDHRRDPGWETGGSLWSELVQVHRESPGHLSAIGRGYLEVPQPGLESLPDAAVGAIEADPGGRREQPTRDEHPSYSSLSTRPDEIPAPPSRVCGSRAPDPSTVNPLAPIELASAESVLRRNGPGARVHSAQAWSGSDRAPCPRCGLSIRRDNLSRHLKRCSARSSPSA